MTTDTPPLQTPRLTLQRPSIADAERLAEIANDRRIATNLTAVFPHPYTLADAEEYVGAGAKESHGVYLDGELIGIVGSHPDKHDPALVTFGYWLGVDYWGCGYATEAGAAVLDHLPAGVRRVEAGVYSWNPASAAVLTKLGFVHEATLAKRAQRFDQVGDEWIFALLP